jgi:protein required for attachment to host cells
MSQKYEHRTPGNTWIVVADRARARIYDSVWPELARLDEVGDLVHPEATLHVRDTISDGPGAFRQSQTGPHAGEPRTDFPHRMAEEFAHQLAAHLDAARLKGSFGHLVVVAPPLMLAALRREMRHPLGELVVDEIDSDYIDLAPAELRQRLLQHVQAASA